MKQLTQNQWHVLHHLDRYPGDPLIDVSTVTLRSLVRAGLIVALTTVDGYTLTRLGREREWKRSKILVHRTTPS